MPPDLIVAACCCCSSRTVFGGGDVQGDADQSGPGLSQFHIGVTGISATIKKGLAVTVESVEAGTPAAGKFNQGNILMAVNGRPLSDPEPWVALGRALAPPKLPTADNVSRSGGEGRASRHNHSGARGLQQDLAPGMREVQENHPTDGRTRLEETSTSWASA